MNRGTEYFIRPIRLWSIQFVRRIRQKNKACANVRTHIDIFRGMYTSLGTCGILVCMLRSWGKIQGKLYAVSDAFAGAITIHFRNKRDRVPLILRKRTSWTSTEEQILIESCKEHNISLKGNGSSKKREEIAHELNRSSGEVNSCSSINRGTQCKDKPSRVYAKPATCPKELCIKK